MKKSIIKTVTALVLSFIYISISVFIPSPEEVRAATKGITVEGFAKILAEELSLSPVTGDTDSDYINVLLEKGIIAEGDFASYKAKLTRGDAMVLLNRSDEYLYGDTLEQELINLVINQRISDVTVVAENKREDVAKAYLKGYVKGYSNGEYSTDRCMKVQDDISKAGALNCIKMLKDKSLRAQLSTDGQLLRTNDLPKYAKYYPYILASFPNSYYDWKFYYEDMYLYHPETGIKEDFEIIQDFATPVDIDKTTDFSNIKYVKEEYLEVWVGKVKTYMQRVFSADYRTIDENWIYAVLSTDYVCGDKTGEEYRRKELVEYVEAMKKNKTIVEYSKIAIDGSSLYFFDGSYYLRTYIKYRIISSNVQYGADTITLINDRPYNKILYCRDLVSLSPFINKEWREGHYDVALGWLNKKSGDKIGIYTAYLNDNYYSGRRTDK